MPTSHHILHIGDTHLCPGPRQADRLAALDAIVAHATRRAEAHTLAAVVWPGDLYHQQSAVEDRNELVDRLQKLARMAPVIICSGNHDREGDLAVLAKVESIFPILVITQPETVCVLSASTPQVEIACYVLPYPHKGGLVAAGVEHQALADHARHILEVEILSRAHDLAVDGEHGRLTLMATHINVAGSISSVGQPQIGREIELPMSALDILPPHVAVLGSHIHKHQQVGRLVYAGSICRMDFGEQEDKGFIEYEFLVTQKLCPRPFTWRFIPLSMPMQHQVEGTLTREAFTIDTVNGEPVGEPIDWTGSDVRCKYHFKKAEVGALDVAKVHVEFAGVRSLKLDPVPELAHTVRAPQIATAKTLEEKVIECAKLQGISMTRRLLAKVGALQTLDREALLRMVQENAHGARLEPAVAGGGS